MTQALEEAVLELEPVNEPKAPGQGKPKKAAATEKRKGSKGRPYRAVTDDEKAGIRAVAEKCMNLGWPEDFLVNRLTAFENWYGKQKPNMANNDWAATFENWLLKQPYQAQAARRPSVTDIANSIFEIEE